MPGALQSPPDPRDWIFESLNHGHDMKNIDNLPEEYDLRDYSQPTRDQGKRGTCAAFAGASIKEIQENQKSNFNEWMSPEFIYYYRGNKPISGMYGRNVFQVLQKIGSIPELSYIYENIDNKSKPPTKKQLQVGMKYCISNYARVMTIDGAKRALIDVGPIYISLPLYTNRPEFWIATEGEKCLAGHAVVIVGYNAQGFILRNSWGPNWNNDGHVILPYNDWTKHWECWVGFDVKSVEKKDKSCIIL